MLKTVVCDDELPALELMTAMLDETGLVEITKTCQSVSDAIQTVNRGGVDLLVLDIEMPEVSGICAVNGIDIDPKPLLVFATAHPEYAAEAFGMDAIDYVLKPFDRSRVRHAIEKAFRLHRLIGATDGHEDRTDETVSGAPESETLRIQDGHRYYVVPLNDIVWIEAAGDYSLIHRATSEIAVRRTLSSLEETLPADQFLRVHRSALISLDQLEEVRRLAKGEANITLRGGVTVKSSRSYKKAIERLIALR